MSGGPLSLVTRTACPVCGAGGGAVVVDLAYDEPPISEYLDSFYGGALDPSRLSGQRYRLVACEGCGLTYQEGVPDEAFLVELYDETLLRDADEVARERGLAVRQGYALQVEQLLAHAAKPPHEVRVVDFGAGQSPWLAMAAAFGCDTAAIELSQHKLDEAASAGHRTFAADDLPEDWFDFVNTEQVFEHLTDPVPTARRLARALRPGGILRISVPAAPDIAERIAAADWAAPKGTARSLNPVAPLEHLNCYQHRTLVRLGREAGLTPFRYPLREQLGPMARLRPTLGGLVHRVRPPRGAIVLLRKEPGAAAGQPSSA